MRGAPTSRGTARVVFSGLALRAGALPISGLAQQPPLPADELTQAILRYAFRQEGGNARVVPGRVPDDLAPNFYAPPGTRVLGTIVAGSSAVVLAATQLPSDSLRAEYARVLEPRGWKPWEPWGRGGFVASIADAPLVFCREDVSLHIMHRRRPAPPHDLQLEYREGGAMCERPFAERAEFMRIEQPRFPTLRSPEPPPGRPTQRCYSRGSARRGSGSIGTGTTVSTDLPPAELLQYYARQLEAAGWSPPGRGVSPPMVGGTWTRTDSAGVSQVVTLEVTERAPGSGCYEVQMNVSR